MANRFPAHIVIGGDLPRRKARLLIAAINEEQLRLDWNHFEDVEISTTRELRELIEEDTGYLKLFDPEAREGKFETLEKVCGELGLAYDRYSDPDDGEDGERVSLRAGVRSRSVIDASREDVVPVSLVASALGLLQAGHVRKAARALDELVQQLPELPEFRIVPSRS